MPTDPDADIRAAVHQIMRDWVGFRPDAISSFLDAVADDFTGYGTGPGDYYADRVALRSMVEREQAEMPYPFTVDIPWMTVHRLRPTLALVVGQIEVEIYADAETITETPRFTFVLDQRDAQWCLVHFHFSVPDAMQSVGDTMGDLLTTRNRQLEAEVVRRTAELKEAQARLVQQEKMASLGQLTAGIAHEIKNPLNFVTNFAGLSRELVSDLQTEADPEEREALLSDLGTNAEKIEAHALRADAIVRSMMDHARSGVGQRQRVEVNALVMDALDRAIHGRLARLPDADTRVELALAADAGDVDVVPDEIARVLINLLDNAFDAIEDRAEEASDSPRVRVSTRQTKNVVEIQVADEGPGMNEAVRQRVFEPFFTTKPPGKGTGLGLSLSYDVVTQGHGGTLTLESEPGQGTVVTIALPDAGSEPIA